MNITIAICTWNRAALLDRTLTEMRNLRVPAGIQWELLVVNNNCTDDTSAVIARHAAALPLREIHEPKQGHSHARNCAIDAAAGELLIWTDDDVLVEPEWLAEYDAAARAFPEASYFGGNVEPWFEVDPPAWISDNLLDLRGVLAICQGERVVRPLQPGDGIVGASMAFRTDLLRRLRFDTTLGRVGNALISGDDMDMLRRVRAEGRSGVWVGTAVVRHFVPRARLTTSYASRWFRGGGQTNVRIHGLPPGRGVFGIPVWLLRQYLNQTVRSWIGSVRKGPNWFRAFRARAVAAGMIAEARRNQRTLATVSATATPQPTTRA